MGVGLNSTVARLIGAAIATNIALLCDLILAIVLLRRRSILHLSRKDWHFSPATIREIFAIGLPASFTMLLMGINPWIISSYGTDTVALLTLSALFYGSHRYQLLSKIISFALLCSLTMFMWPHLFLRFFTDKTEPLRLAAPYLRLEIFCFPFMAITISCNRALQGLGPTGCPVWGNQRRLAVSGRHRLSLRLHNFSRNRRHLAQKETGKHSHRGNLTALSICE